MIESGHNTINSNYGDILFVDEDGNPIEAGAERVIYVDVNGIQIPEDVADSLLRSGEFIDARELFGYAANNVPLPSANIAFSKNSSNVPLRHPQEILEYNQSAGQRIDAPIIQRDNSVNRLLIEQQQTPKQSNSQILNFQQNDVNKSTSSIMAKEIKSRNVSQGSLTQKQEQFQQNVIQLQNLIKEEQQKPKIEATKCTNAIGTQETTAQQPKPVQQLIKSENQINLEQKQNINLNKNEEVKKQAPPPQALPVVQSKIEIDVKKQIQIEPDIKTPIAVKTQDDIKKVVDLPKQQENLAQNQLKQETTKQLTQIELQKIQQHEEMERQKQKKMQEIDSRFTQEIKLIPESTFSFQNERIQTFDNQNASKQPQNKQFFDDYYVQPVKLIGFLDKKVPKTQQNPCGIDFDRLNKICKDNKIDLEFPATNLADLKYNTFVDPFSSAIFQDEVIDIDYGAIDSFTSAINEESKKEQSYANGADNNIKCESHFQKANYSSFIDNQILLSDYGQTNAFTNEFNMADTSVEFVSFDSFNQHYQKHGDFNIQTSYNERPVSAKQNFVNSNSIYDAKKDDEKFYNEFRGMLKVKQ